jgi:hypothetical protein
MLFLPVIVYNVGVNTVAPDQLHGLLVPAPASRVKNTDKTVGVGGVLAVVKAVAYAVQNQGARVYDL